jgi:membrane protease YdiL (CAAX protease family)
VAEQEPSLFGAGWKFFGQYTYKPSITFDILVLVTIGVQLYLYIKYVNDPQAQSMLPFNVLNIFFCVVGRFAYDLARMKLQPFNVLNLVKKNPKEDNFTIGDGILAFGLFMVIAFTQSIRFVKLNVSALDQFLFYVFAAPAEESFFRYFLTGIAIIIGALIIRSVMKREPKRWEEVTLKAVVGLITGLIFGFAHASRYADLDLLVIILNGIEFSVTYAFVRKIDAVLLAHVALNIRAGIEVFA